MGAVVLHGVHCQAIYLAWFRIDLFYRRACGEASEGENWRERKRERDGEGVGERRRERGSGRERDRERKKERKEGRRQRERQLIRMKGTLMS